MWLSAAPLRVWAGFVTIQLWRTQGLFPPAAAVHPHFSCCSPTHSIQATAGGGRLCTCSESAGLGLAGTMNASWAAGRRAWPSCCPIAFPLSVLPFLSEPLGPSLPRVQKHSLEVPRLVLCPPSTGVWLGPASGDPGAVSGGWTAWMSPLPPGVEAPLAGHLP